MEGKSIKVSAPGKVIIHGEHSVLYGKTALAVALGLRSTVAIKELPPTDDPKIHVEFPNVGLHEKLSLKAVFDLFSITSGDNPQDWTRPEELDHDVHLRKVDEALRKVRPAFDDLPSNQKSSLRGFLYAFGGIFASSSRIADLSVSVTTDLTVGAGTGSSASFAVCLCGAMVQLVKLKSAGRVTDFSPEERRIVSAWAFNCEKITHGAPSGIDNTTCTYGSLVSFKKGEEPLLLSSPEFRILLVDSRVGRETSKLVASVAALRSRNRAAVDHIMDAVDHVAVTAAALLEKLSRTKSSTDIDVIYEQLNELWGMNHCLLAALGVSHPALEAIRSAASGRGLACKLTGAGGGGNAIVLIPPSTEEAKVEELKAELLNGGFRVTDTLVGGAGIQNHE
ncbi:unnamed protein product, partial [Iphiclides podalirius]